MNQQDRIEGLTKILAHYFSDVPGENIGDEIEHKIDDYYSQLFPQPPDDRAEPPLVKLDPDEDPALYRFHEGAEAQRRADIKFFQPKIEQERERIMKALAGESFVHNPLGKQRIQNFIKRNRG